MNKQPVLTNTKIMYQGTLLTLKELQFLYDDGVIKTLEVIEHIGAAVVLPITAEGNLLLVRQYRPAAGYDFLELPAGLLEPDEEPYDTAQRELLEETGYEAGNMEYLTSLYTTPGYSNEVLYLYKATALEQVSTVIEKGLSLEEKSPQEVLELAKKGAIQDGKTLAGLFYYFFLSS